MKVPLKTHRTSDLGTKHTKSSKKSKGAKKPIEKNNKDLSPKDSDLDENSTEVASKIEPESVDLKKNPLNLRKTEAEPVNLKKNSLDLRKTEASEWKFLKKTDCQRLETVFEEGHTSSDERISKTCGNISLEESDEEVDPESKPSENEIKFFPFSEVLDTVEEEKESEKEEENEPPEVEDPSPENGKGSFQREATEVDPVEVTSSRSKKGIFPVNPKEKVEILPIFSNNKFNCSRDAISIGESEDLFTCKNSTALMATENKKEVRFDRKDVYESESNGVSIQPKLGPTSAFVLRFKAFTEKYVPQTPSPFINSLLVLAPFSEERKMLLNKEIMDKNNKAEEKLQRTKLLNTSTGPNFATEAGTNTGLAMRSKKCLETDNATDSS